MTRRHPDPPEVRGLPQHGDMAINCGVAVFETNGIWISIREGGRNQVIFVSEANAAKFRDQLGHVLDQCD